MYAKLAKLDIRHFSIFFSRSGWHSLSIQGDFILPFPRNLKKILEGIISALVFLLLLFYLFIHSFLLSFLYFHVNDGMIRRG